jgi:myo-inositol-1-phosphate synthase
VSINIGIIGIGNCASSLLQGIYHYGEKTPEDAIGLMNWEIGGYKPGDIRVVEAFDIDGRKVGKDVNEAIFCKPNCATFFFKDIPKSGIKVRMGRVLDGFSGHMREYDERHTFLLADEAETSRKEVVKALRDSGTDVLINYLPVGSEEATKFYAKCALEAGTAFLNSIPVFIASDPEWSERFRKENIPLIGDDIKSQLGATITHRTLTDLFNKRGVKLERTYQLNTGGNTDFLNMLNRSRLASKKISKTAAVQAVTSERLDEDNIHIGPSDYVPWQKDNKVCFIRMEGRLFGDVPVELELRLSVEDSPNSAGVAIDAVRCAKVALERGEGGVLHAPSAYFCKHPPRQYTDDEAHSMIRAFIDRKSEKSHEVPDHSGWEGQPLRA